MKITCRDCGYDFHFAETRSDPTPAESACPYCRSPFRVGRDTAGKPQAVFTRPLPVKKICANCFREFESVGDEAIPICPDCGKEKTEALSGPKLPTPQKTVGNPFAQTVQTSYIRKFFRKYFQPYKLFLKIVLAVALLCAAWAAYRIVSFKAPPAADPQLTRYALALKETMPPPSRPADVLIEEAGQKMLLDLPSQYDAAAKLLEQALVLDPYSPRAMEILPLLAEAYAYAAQTGNDARLSAAAQDIVNLEARLHPDRPEGFTAKARIALTTGNTALAEEMAGKAAANKPDGENVLLTRTAILISSADREKLKEAAAIAESVLKKNPDRLESYDLISQAKILLAEPEAAARAAERRLAQNPRDPKALYTLGYIESRAADHEKAKEWYQESLRAGPDYVPPRLGLALIYSRIDGDGTLAQRHLKDIITRYRRFASPDEILTAQKELARIFLEDKRPGEAEEITRPFAAVLSKIPGLATARAKALEASGKKDEALAVLQSRVKIPPAEPETMLQLARTLERQASESETAAAYRAAATAEPLRPDPYLYFLHFLLRKERFEEALDIAGTVLSRVDVTGGGEIWLPLDRQPDPTPWDFFIPRLELLRKKYPASGAALALLGLAELRNGEPRSALKFFAEAGRKTSSADYLFLYEGQAHFMLSEWGKAGRAFKTALDARPGNPAALYWLGKARFKQKDPAGAQPLLEQAAADPVWGFRALHALGEIAAARGKRDVAETFWKKSLGKEPAYVPAWRSLLRH